MGFSNWICISLLSWTNGNGMFSLLLCNWRAVRDCFCNNFVLNFYKNSPKQCFAHIFGKDFISWSKMDGFIIIEDLCLESYENLSFKMLIANWDLNCKVFLWIFCIFSPFKRFVHNLDIISKWIFKDFYQVINRRFRNSFLGQLESIFTVLDFFCKFICKNGPFEEAATITLLCFFPKKAKRICVISWPYIILFFPDLICRCLLLLQVFGPVWTLLPLCGFWSFLVPCMGGLG